MPIEQVRVFRDAEAVVAPHGSGLANVVFSSPGAKLIELFPEVTVDLYFRVSRALGLDYAYVKAPGEAERMRRHDYAVPVEDVRKTLELLEIA